MCKWAKALVYWWRSTAIGWSMCSRFGIAGDPTGISAYMERYQSSTEKRKLIWLISLSHFISLSPSNSISISPLHFYLFVFTLISHQLIYLNILQEIDFYNYGAWLSKANPKWLRQVVRKERPWAGCNPMGISCGLLSTGRNLNSWKA